MKDKIMATTNSGKPKSIAKRVPLKSVAAAKAKAIQNETTRKIIISTSPPAKVKETLRNSNGSVRVVPPTSNTSRADSNHQATLNASRAKSGNTAKQGAFFVDEFNSAMRNVSKPPVLKVRSTGGLGGGGTLKNVIR